MACVGMAQMRVHLSNRQWKKHLKHAMLSVVIEVVVLHLHTDLHTGIGLLVCFIATDHIHMEAVDPIRNVT